MGGENDYFQFGESELDLEKMIPFFAEGPWRYTGSNRDLVVERLPVEFWQAGRLRDEGRYSRRKRTVRRVPTWGLIRFVGLFAVRRQDSRR